VRALTRLPYFPSGRALCQHALRGFSDPLADVARSESDQDSPRRRSRSTGSVPRLRVLLGAVVVSSVLAGVAHGQTAEPVGGPLGTLEGEPASAAAVEAVGGSEAEPDPETEPESAGGSEAEPDPETEPESAGGSEAEPDPETEPESAGGSESEPDPDESAPETQAVVEPSPPPPSQDAQDSPTEGAASNDSSEVNQPASVETDPAPAVEQIENQQATPAELEHSSEDEPVAADASDSRPQAELAIRERLTQTLPSLMTCSQALGIFVGVGSSRWPPLAVEVAAEQGLPALASKVAPRIRPARHSNERGTPDRPQSPPPPPPPSPGVLAGAGAASGSSSGSSGLSAVLPGLVTLPLARGTSVVLAPRSAPASLELPLQLERPG
jgi:hypothetical protein